MEYRLQAEVSGRERFRLKAALHARSGPNADRLTYFPLVISRGVPGFD